MRIWAYVDGFNLYNGSLRRNPAYKWLNLQTFAEQLRPTDQVTKVKFFSAKIDARPSDPDQPLRQIAYWRALRTVPTIEIVEGHFLTKPTYLPEVASVDSITADHIAGRNMQGVRPTMAHVYRSEEKGTDVNLAVHLLHDAHLGRFDAAIVVSNDSDLAQAIRIVRREVNKKVFAFYPPTPRPSYQLGREANRFKEISVASLANSQFPAALADGTGPFNKPATW